MVMPSEPTTLAEAAQAIEAGCTWMAKTLGKAEAERDLAQLAGARAETAEAIIRALVDQLDPSSAYDQGEAVTAALHWLRNGGS